MPIKKSLVSFEEGLSVLQRSNDFISLRETINEMLSIVPPQKAHLAKDKIARTMRRKQALEIQQAQGYPDVLQAIDKKYNDLALVLRHASAPKGLKVPEGQLYKGPEPVSAAISKKPSTGLAGLGGNFGSMMLLNWIKAKRPLLVRGVAFAGIGGVAYWAYQKYLGDGKKTRNNPDKESDFDRTIRSIQKYKAFSKMTKDPDWSGNYEDLMGSRKKSKKKNKNAKRNPSKLEEWEGEEQNLFKAMDSAYRSLGDKPQFKCDIPQLPEPRKVRNPVLVASNSNKSSKRPKKPKKKAKKSKPVIEETVEMDIPKKEVSVKAKVKKPKASKKPRKTKSSDGRLIPIVKRTKRIRKIS